MIVGRPFFESTPTHSLNPHSIHILGFRFDGTSCFRKGAHLGPDALREVSDSLEDYSPYLKKSLKDFKFFDLGNLPYIEGLGDAAFAKNYEHFKRLFDNYCVRKNNVKLITLGGEHSISYAPIMKYLDAYPDLAIVHLDAHADLMEAYLGDYHSHNSIIHCVSKKIKSPSQLIQYGIRSGTREEFRWMEKNKTLCQSKSELLERLDLIDSNHPIYLTLDLDFFDPAFLPGTGTPEAGGEDFGTYISIIKILAKKNLVAADIVELAPQIDPTNNSASFAAKTLRELIICMGLS